MSDFVAMIQAEVDRAIRARFVDKYGHVTSYDPSKNLEKVKVQPEGYETGWLRIHEPSIGNGWGIVSGLSVGDQVKLESTNGDVNNLYIAGRVHSDADAAPVAQSGELVLRHSSGTQLKMSSDGTLSIAGSGDINITSSGTVSVN